MPRATPLPPDERRATLIAATAPLLEAYGTAVSTRQIAEAAGVAEGTIFRVFATKQELIEAVCGEAFDLEQVRADLSHVPANASLEDRLLVAVEVLQQRLRRIFALFHVMHDQRREGVSAADHRARQRGDNERLDALLTTLLEPAAEELRMPPTAAASLVRVLTLALTHPMLNDASPCETRQIVDLLLHGVTPAENGHTAC